MVTFYFLRVFIWFALFSPFIISGQERDSVSIMYNWANGGLLLRSQPSPDAEIIENIPYGSTLEVDQNQVNSPSHAIKVFNQNNAYFQLDGKYVKVKHKDQEGYAFSGYLMDFKPMVNKSGTSTPEDWDFYLAETGKYGNACGATQEKGPYQSKTITIAFDKGATVCYQDDGEVGQSLRTRLVLPGTNFQTAFLMVKNWAVLSYSASGNTEPFKLFSSKIEYNKLMELFFYSDVEVEITIERSEIMNDDFTVIYIHEWMD